LAEIREVTYIPNDNGTSAPSDAGLDVLGESDVIVEELEKVIRFFLLVADDVASDWCG
jgi:hypothetical protein